MTTAVRDRGRQAARRRPRGGAGRDGRPARERLLRAAAELAPQHGYELLQVGELAAAAGVSRQTFYAHFADKRQCVSEVSDPRLAAVERELRAACEEGNAWASPLLAALDETLGGLFSSPRSERRILLETILDLAERQGLAAVRLGAVVEAAGMSHRIFYNHFEGKSQCFATAVAELIEGLELQARGSVELLIDRLAGDPRAARILLIEVGSMPEPCGDEPGQTGPRSFTALVERLLFGAELEPSDAARDAVSRRLAIGALIETLRTDVLRGQTGAMLAHAAAWRELFAAELGQPQAARR